MFNLSKVDKYCGINSKMGREWLEGLVALLELFIWDMLILIPYYFIIAWIRWASNSGCYLGGEQPGERKRYMSLDVGAWCVCGRAMKPE